MRNPLRNFARRLMLATAACVLASTAAAQTAAPFNPLEGEIRGLKLGLSADAMPAGFMKYACGSNGLVPTLPLKEWTEFKSCKKDDKGLYEVAAQYDSVGQHLVDMFAEMFTEEEGKLWIDQYMGTKMAGHPVILSVLFDDKGIVQGIRAVTDSRARLDQRRVANVLGNVIRNHYEPQNWTCETLPLAPGESPIGNSYVKQRCDTVYRGERRMIIWRNFYRKPGQTGIDTTGRPVDGEWESSTRWEVWALTVAVN